jgi:NIMA (never in mitosis gene a)-related kinase
LEYADGGDILRLVNNHKKKNTHFTEKEIWYYFI